MLRKLLRRSEGGLQTVNNWAKKNTEAGGTATVYEYEKEGHGFMNAGKDIHEMMKSELFLLTPVP